MAVADLQVEKVFVETVGSNAVFLMTVTNNGPITANDVVVSDVSTREITEAPAFCGPGLFTTECSLGSIAAGESVSFQIKTLYPDASDTATVVSTTPDPDPANNTDTATAP